jgi:hypothetical protein
MQCIAVTHTSRSQRGKYPSLRNNAFYLELSFVLRAIRCDKCNGGFQRQLFKNCFILLPIFLKLQSISTSMCHINTTHLDSSKLDHLVSSCAHSSLSKHRLTTL